LSLTETSRHLSRIDEVGLAIKTPNGFYNITPFGKVCLNQLRAIEFTSKNRNYFNNHSIERLPRDLLGKLDMLSKSKYIDDTLIALQVVKRIIDEAKTYLFRLSNQFVMVLLEPVIAATERGIKYSFIYSADIKLPPDATETVRLRKARKSDNFFPYTHSNIVAFMVLSEKEAMVSFPKLDGNYDYTGFNSINKEFLIWCRELYEHHSVDRQPTLPIWRGIP
jgi:predicted transcriptional regulator